MAWSGTISGNVSCAYDKDFRIVSQSINNENTISLAYDDPDGLLTKVGDFRLVYHTASGLLTGTIHGAFHDFLSYNDFGEVANYRATYNSNDIFEVAYTTDRLGRIIEKRETVGGEAHTYRYSYDHVGQLIEVKTDGLLTAHYEYDSNGNRLSRSTTTETTNGTYDAQDRLTRYGGNTYRYTANGELEEKNDNDGTTIYTYTALSALRTATLPDGRKIEYVLDGQERRIGKKVDDVLVQGFLYENTIKPVAELDSSNRIVARFVYAGGNTPDYVIKNGHTYQIVSDHLGSPRLVIDISTGNIVQKMEYDEYGRLLLDTNPGFQPFGFAGGIYDRDTGLLQFGLREYDPETGRWTSKDPIDFDGGDSNLYRYVQNDPVNYADSTGLSMNMLKTGISWLSPIDPFAIMEGYNDYWNRTILGDYSGAAMALALLSLEVNPGTSKAKKAAKAAKGVSKKLIKKGTDDIIEIAKFSGKGNKKTYKHWILEKDYSAGKPTAHRGSYWKLKNKNDKGFRRTLTKDGRIVDD